MKLDAEKAGGQSSPNHGHLMTCNHGLNALNVGVRRNNSISVTFRGDVRSLTLYAVARWLDEYREIALKLPRIIEDHGVISLNGALQPSYWAPAMRLCIDAAPINRSLGIGMNWMIRELLRHGVYEPRDESLMASYCWAPSERVRELLTTLGADVGARADKEASRAIHEFVVEHIGVDHARFNGDFDLPLQLITRETHRAALDSVLRSSR